MPPKKTVTTASNKSDEETMTVADMYQSLKADLDTLKSDMTSSQKLASDNHNSLTKDLSDIKDSLTEKIETVDARVDDLQEQVKSLKTKVKKSDIETNFRGQRDRKNGMKLNCYKLEEDIAKDGERLQKHVFEKVLSPIFQKAVDSPKCKLDKLPSFLESIDALHILPVPESKKKKPVGLPDDEPAIPQIQIKFRSSEYKSFICSFKKSFLEDLNRSGGTTHLIDDRTPVNARCMAILRADTTVDPMSVKLQNCRIRFKKKGSEKSFLVTDPFGDNLAEFLK